MNDSRRTVLLIMVMALLGVTGAALASDPPHWVGASEAIDCTSNCHVTHQAGGGQLTSHASNVALCQSCHNDLGGLPINHTDRADPILGTGRSHYFDMSATNPIYGALPPQNQEMSLRVMGGNVVCSTCHNQHSAESALGGTPRISPAQDLGASGGTLTSGGLYVGTVGAWYLVEITSTAPTELRYSKDNEASWFGPTGFTYDTPLGLDSGVEVTVTSGVAAGDRWEFYGGWPFLRTALDSGANTGGSDFCRDCHRDFTMDHTAVEEDGWGTATFKSHPVGIQLDVNGQGYDRATPLDGNGLAQAAGGQPDVDGNPTNDLRLDGSDPQLVQCTSCHGVHYADSNTLSVDQP